MGKAMSSDVLSKVNAGTISLYGAGLDTTNYVTRAFDFLNGLMPSELNAYGSLDREKGQLDACFDRYPAGVGAALTAYGMLMHKYEPLRFDPTVNEGRPYAVRDFFSRPHFHDLDVFHEVYSPLGYEDQCFVHVPTKENVTIYFGLFRGSVFREHDKEVLTLAQSHLRDARRLARAHTANAGAPTGPEVFTRYGFTSRECEIICWLVRGHTNSEIAQQLRVPADVVGASLLIIYEKMGVVSRVDAIVTALDMARQIVMPAPFSVAAPGEVEILAGS